jgi:hypothetical protein
MIAVTALNLTDTDDGRQCLTVTFAGDPPRTLAVYGRLYAEPHTLKRDEMISWRLVFNAFPAPGAGAYAWGHHSYRPSYPDTPR